MVKAKEKGRRVLAPIKKSRTYITGFDEITAGGLPKGRPSLVTGSAGSGKTLFGLEFLVNGVLRADEPGVFLAFEETAEELASNVASLGIDLEELQRQKKLALDYVYIERAEIEETGEYDLEGLFVRLDYQIDGIGAKRVVLDTLEALFAALPNEGILRAELRRLFRWLKKKGVTAVITAERGEGSLTRFGLEEYVADCVVLLDHRVINEISTRRLRVVKYRGSSHGTNEYPFLIDEHGISVLPITSLGLDYPAPEERVSSGIPRLDVMLGGRGFYRGSTVLVSGTAGTGKSSFAASFAKSVCSAGKRCIYFAFEESRAQILRNMRSIGIDLEPYTRKGLLAFSASRPTVSGLEMHLVSMLKLVRELKPDAVIVDPITNLVTSGSEAEVKGMLTRFIHHLKSKQITGMFTSLTGGQVSEEMTGVGISSLVDTWLVLKDIDRDGERNRVLLIVKSRGMAHSNQVREFSITGHGIEIPEVYPAAAGPTGVERATREAEERTDEASRLQEIARKERQLERKRKMVEGADGGTPR